MDRKKRLTRKFLFLLSKRGFLNESCQVVRVVILLLSLLFVCDGVSQSNPEVADSLGNIINDISTDLATKEDALVRVLRYESDPRNLIDYGNQLVEIASDNQNKKNLHFAYLGLGNGYLILGDLISSSDYYFKAKAIAEEIDYPEGVGYSLGRLASSYKQLKNFDLSAKYYQEALEVFRILKDSVMQGVILTNLGYNYYSLNELPTARKYMMEGIWFFERHYRAGLNYARGNLALIDLKLGNASALDSLKIVIEELKLKQDDFAVSDYLSQISGILGAQGQVNEAIAAGEESLVLSKQLGLKEQIRDASENLCELYKAKGEFRKALEYQSQFILYKDSINNIETVNQIANLRTEFEVGQEKAKVDLLMAQRKVRNIYGVAMMIGLGSVIALAIFQYYNSRQRKRINEQLREQKAELESQKEQLESQKSELENVNRTKDRFFSIISHDLRGPVNAFHGVSRMIKFFVQNKQMDQLEVLAEDIDQSVDRLSALLDNLLNWAVQQQGEFPYVPEKVNIKLLAEDLVDTFTTMAKSKEINLQASVPEELEVWADRNTTMTIIRNLVSNALKFTPKGGEVKIQADRQEGTVKIEVRDNGVGIPEEKIKHLFKLNEEASTWGTEGEKGLGLGLQLVNEFVELNGGNISVKSSETEGTTFTVYLPSYTLDHVSAEA